MSRLRRPNAGCPRPKTWNLPPGTCNPLLHPQALILAFWTTNGDTTPAMSEFTLSNLRSPRRPEGSDTEVRSPRRLERAKQHPGPPGVPCSDSSRRPWTRETVAIRGDRQPSSPHPHASVPLRFLAAPCPQLIENKPRRAPLPQPPCLPLNFQLSTGHRPRLTATRREVKLLQVIENTTRRHFLTATKPYVSEEKAKVQPQIPSCLFPRSPRTGDSPASFRLPALDSHFGGELVSDRRL